MGLRRQKTGAQRARDLPCAEQARGEHADLPQNSDVLQIREEITQ
jgi:hypothetical protein